MEKRLAELLGKDLAGWQFVNGYFLELSHDVMGFFPAVVAKTDETVVCLSKKILGRVAECLPARESEVGECLLLVNTEKKQSFSIQCNEGLWKLVPVYVLTEEEFFQQVGKGAEVFKWQTSGMIQLKETDPDRVWKYEEEGEKD